MSAQKFRKMTRREFMELMALAGGASFLAACGGGAAAPEEEATVEILPTPSPQPTLALEVPTAAPKTEETPTTAPEPTADLEKKKYGGIYRCVAGDLPTLDGPTCNYHDWWLANCALYNRLYDIDPKGKLYVDLAEDWPEVSEDGLTYRFKIKKGITFHNGREMKAEDVKFSIDRNFAAGIYTCGIAYLRNIEGAKEVMALEKPPDFVDLPGTRVLDDYTLEVKLSQPYSIFPLVFIDNTINIVPKQEALAAGSEWGTKVVIGTGPFKFKEWTAGEKVVLERFENYHKPGLPYLDGIEVYLNLDAQATILQFENRELEFVKDIDVETAKRYLNDPVFKNDVMYSDAPWFDYIDLALNTEPFKDVRMRQAFAMAVDKEALTRVSAGSLIPWDTFMSPIISQYDPNWQWKWSYNPDEAAKIVKELYPNGVKVTFWGWNENWMQIIQSDLAKVGIEAEINTKEWGVVWDDLKAGKIHLVWRSWWYGLPDAQNFLEPEDRVGFCDPNDKTRWPSRGECDQTLNDLFIQMSQLPMFDPKRTEAIRKFQDYLMNERLQFVVMFLHKSLDLYAQYVKDVPGGPVIGFPMLETAWIDKEVLAKIKDIKPQS